MPQRGFKGLAVSGLDDEQLTELVLSNWHKLNAVLQLRPSLAELQRLLFLELKRPKPRWNFVERLRSTIISARSTVSKAALTRVKKTAESSTSRTFEDYIEMGLDEKLARKLVRVH